MLSLTKDEHSEVMHAMLSRVDGLIAHLASLEQTALKLSDQELLGRYEIIIAKNQVYLAAAQSALHKLMVVSPV